MISHMPVPAPHAVVASHPRTYTVVPGDDLWHIAGRFYGSAWTAKWWQIYQANLAVIGTDPNLIKPGELLTIPPFSARSAPPPASPPRNSPPASPLPAATGTPQPGVPWSIFNQPNGQAEAVSFARALLRAINAPATPGNLQVIYDWQMSEGSGGWYNPMNGGNFGNLAVSGEQYGGGANNYPDLATNVRAMALGLTSNPQYGYSAIVSALQARNSSAARQAIWAPAWAASHYGYGSSWNNDPLP